jgi:8-oxo-dGTP pyrophosphatase MutT (NUDIX family)
MSETPKPAATVVVLRDSPRGPEIFMVKRSGKSGFMPHAHVFPGGRVDPEDAQTPVQGGDADLSRMGLSRDLAVAYQVCAVRETFEEANVLLAEGTPHADERRALNARETTFHEAAERQGWVVDGSRLVYWSWWITPREERRRYDTRFFVAGVTREQTVDAAHDAKEVVDSDWWTAAETLERFQAGEIFLAPPTYITLMELQDLPTVDAVLAAGRLRQPPPIEPSVGTEPDGSLAIVMPGDPEHRQSEPIPGLPRRLVMSQGRWIRR